MTTNEQAFIEDLFNVIAKGEGTSEDIAKAKGFNSGYDVPYNHGGYLMPPKPLTQMTVGEVLEYQKELYQASKEKGAKIPSSPVGRYQIIGKTLRKWVEDGVVGENEIFNAETQDKLGMELLNDAGLKTFLNSDMSQEAINTFHNNVAQKWAGVPDITGKSAHKGQNAGIGTNIVSNVISGMGNAHISGQNIFERRSTQGNTQKASSEEVTKKKFDPSKYIEQDGKYYAKKSIPELVDSKRWTDNEFDGATASFNFDKALEKLKDDPNADKGKIRRLEKLKDKLSGKKIKLSRDGEYIDWSWKDGSLDDDRISGVAEQDKSNVGFGGKGFLGLAGSEYEEILSDLIMSDSLEYDQIEVAKEVADLENGPIDLSSFEGFEGDSTTQGGSGGDGSSNSAGGNSGGDGANQGNSGGGNYYEDFSGRSKGLRKTSGVIGEDQTDLDNINSQVEEEYSELNSDLSDTNSNLATLDSDIVHQDPDYYDRSWAGSFLSGLWDNADQYLEGTFDVLGGLGDWATGVMDATPKAYRVNESELDPSIPILNDSEIYSARGSSGYIAKKGDNYYSWSPTLGKWVPKTNAHKFTKFIDESEPHPLQPFKDGNNRIVEGLSNMGKGGAKASFHFVTQGLDRVGLDSNKAKSLISREPDGINDVKPTGNQSNPNSENFPNVPGWGQSQGNNPNLDQNGWAKISTEPVTPQRNNTNRNLPNVPWWNYGSGSNVDENGWARIPTEPVLSQSDQYAIEGYYKNDNGYFVKYKDGRFMSYDNLKEWGREANKDEITGVQRVSEDELPKRDATGNVLGLGSRSFDPQKDWIGRFQLGGIIGQAIPGLVDGVTGIIGKNKQQPAAGAQMPALTTGAPGMTDTTGQTVDLSDATINKIIMGIKGGQQPTGTTGGAMGAVSKLVPKGLGMDAGAIGNLAGTLMAKNGTKIPKGAEGLSMMKGLGVGKVVGKNEPLNDLDGLDELEHDYNSTAVALNAAKSRMQGIDLNKGKLRHGSASGGVRHKSSEENLVDNPFKGSPDNLMSKVGRNVDLNAITQYLASKPIRGNSVEMKVAPRAKLQMRAPNTGMTTEQQRIAKQDVANNFSELKTSNPNDVRGAEIKAKAMSDFETNAQGQLAQNKLASQSQYEQAMNQDRMQQQQYDQGVLNTKFQNDSAKEMADMQYKTLDQQRKGQLAANLIGNAANVGAAERAAQMQENQAIYGKEMEKYKAEELSALTNLQVLQNTEGATTQEIIDATNAYNQARNKTASMDNKFRGMMHKTQKNIAFNHAAPTSIASIFKSGGKLTEREKEKIKLEKAKLKAKAKEERDHQKKVKEVQKEYLKEVKMTTKKNSQLLKRYFDR